MIELKLNILLENHVISNSVYEDSLKALHFIQTKTDNSSKIDTFITHLAMALQRVENNEVIAVLDDFIYDEVLNTSHFNEVNTLTNELLNYLNINFPEEEIKYLHLHLAQF